MALSTISGTTGITDATITSAKLADFSAAVDLNGVELLLDADQDTSISADTDDTIDIKIGGADDFQFTANTFTALSGSTIKANTIAETTSTSGVTIDGVLLKDGVLGANTVDSDAYVDGSIDTAHIANDQITAALMADNSIDSDMYVDGSIDLAHMSSESVDEDNLYISNSGSNGQFLAKQSGNNGGMTWTTITTEDYIPDGTVMVFFQSAAPTGWTKLTSQNDKTLRVVSGNGGGTGGDWAMTSGETTSSNGAHTHTSAAHTHTGGSLAAGAHTLATNEMPSHTHSVNAGSGGYGGGKAGTPSWGGATGATGGGGSHEHSLSGTSASTTPGSTGSDGAHTHTIAAPQYIDVIICSKDA